MKSAETSLSQNTAPVNGKPRGTFVPEGFKKRIEALTFLIRFGPEFLEPSEFLMLLFHAERSLIYGKSADRASASQMERGVYRKPTATWVRGGCGVSRRHAIESNRALAAGDYGRGARGGTGRAPLLKRRAEASDTPGGPAPTEYEIDWKAFREFVAAQLQAKVAYPENTKGGPGEPAKQPDREYSPPSAVSALPPSATTALPPSAVSALQQREVNHHQRKQEQRREVSTVLVAQPKPALAPKPEEPKENQKSPSVDDEKTQNSPDMDPAARLKLWAERCGGLAEQDWWNLKARAEVKGISLEELADLAEKNNGKWASAAAGLGWLIAKFNSKTKPLPTTAAADDKGKAGPCATCRNLGVARWDPEPVYCDCPMGGEVRRADARIAAERAKADSAPPACKPPTSAPVATNRAAAEAVA